MDTYEKKYKELVGKIEKAYLYAQTDSTKAVLEEIRPELAESEDERIRKALIRFFQWFPYDRLNDENLKPKDAITWLEKQAPKPKWSDEDEELLQHCCGAVAAADYYTLEDKEEMENWLKSLKQRIEQ